MKILIGADIVPTKSNQQLFINGDTDELIGIELHDILKSVDYRIFNLEVPLTDKETPIDKCGPNLIAPEDTIKAMKGMNINLFTLANNHIMDQGIQGLESTCRILQKNNINYVGAGSNLEEAGTPFLIEEHGLKIGIYACAEHEFSIAKEDMPGANPFDALYSLDHIQELKKQCDQVIVLYHGMKEFYRLPTPGLQKTLRRMVEKGADLVICQHNHCIGCEENYKDGKIVYGQGNFLFDRGNDEFWNSALLLQLNIHEEGIDFEYLPIVKRGSIVRLARDKEKVSLLGGYWERSRNASDTQYIQEQYSIEAEKELSKRLRMISGGLGNNFVFKVFNKLCRNKLILCFYSKKQLLALRNYIECEVHHEVLLQGIHDRILKM